MSGTQIGAVCVGSGYGDRWITEMGVIVLALYVDVHRPLARLHWRNARPGDPGAQIWSAGIILIAEQYSTIR